MATHCNTLQHTQVSLYLTSSLLLYSFHTAAATHRITLQHASTHCNTLQHTATHCSTLQHTATHCNTLQHTATHSSLRFSLYSTNSLLLCVFHSAAATHCNTLQHASTHCNTTFLGSNGDLIESRLRVSIVGTCYREDACLFTNVVDFFCPLTHWRVGHKLGNCPGQSPGSYVIDWVLITHVVQ